jgi:hypothetical protein
MNYQLEGAPVPKAVNRGAIIRPAVWRLIWEDTRYRDGSMPEEETLYFRLEESSTPAASVHIDVDTVNSLESNQQMSRPSVWVVFNRLDV